MDISRGTDRHIGATFFESRHSHFLLEHIKKRISECLPLFAFLVYYKLHRRDCLALEESFVVVLVVDLLLRVVLLT